MKYKHLHLLALILCFLSTTRLCSEAYTIQINSLAPLSSKFLSTSTYDIYETNIIINQLLKDKYDIEKIPVYEKLLRTSISIFSGYKNYRSSTGNVNFLSKRGSDLLNNLITLHENITNDRISWKNSYSNFIEMIKFIPSASIDHSSWNLEMFIEVFPGMTSDQIRALKNERNNSYTLQLSKKCTKQCLHCAAISKGRILSAIDHIPLPIILKMLQKMRALNDNSYLKVHLYDHSDIADYKDPVMQTDILPVLDFCKFNGIDSSSFTHGVSENKELFKNYLPETISLHPFHADILKFIRKYINTENHEKMLMKKNKLISKYVNIFLETSSFINPDKKQDIPYEISQNSSDFYHLIKARRYFINTAERSALKKDKNGIKALEILDQFISFQNDIYAEYIEKIKSINSNATVQDENISIIFAGRTAKLLKSFGVSESTIKHMNSFNNNSLYGELIYVIESDGRISPLAPEIYFEETFTIPYKTVEEIFHDSESEDFLKFLVLMQLILESQTGEKIVSQKDISNLIGKKIKQHHKVELRSQDNLEFDSANYIKFLKGFITVNPIVRKLLLNLTKENKNELFDTLRTMPMPLKLNLVKKKIFNIPVKSIDFNFSEIKDDYLYPRRSFNFPLLGNAFRIKVPFNVEGNDQLELNKSA